jgi:hypothetical protein
MDGEFVNWEELHQADLVSGKLYKSGEGHGLSKEALSGLLGVGNTGGFRWRGKSSEASFIVITSTGNEAIWPDSKDGRILRYFGDNRGKRDGQSDLFATRGGNKMLQRNFSLAYGSQAERSQTQIFLYFSAAKSVGWRFDGLALPGAAGHRLADALKVIRRTNPDTGKSFENYLATFTLVRPHLLARKDFENWNLRSLDPSYGPHEWQLWVESPGWWPSYPKSLM